MPFTRRFFLKTSSLINVRAIPCMGFTELNLQRMPKGYIASPDTDEGLTAFFNTQFGPGLWEINNDAANIKIPSQPAHHARIPITIDLNDPSKAGIYRTLIVFVLRYAFMHAPSANKTVINSIAEFQLGEQTISEVSMSLNIPDAAKLRLFIALVPKNPSSKVLVLQQKRPVPLDSCTDIAYF